MPAPDFVLFYVEDPQRSAEFYHRLLGSPPLEASPNFSMFSLPSGLMLGLWRRGDVAPAPEGRPGASELALCVDSETAVRERHDQWRGLGARILQEPTRMDFGFTFLAQDPDGHRLRVFAPATQGS